MNKFSPLEEANDAQLRAASPDRSVWVGASAGTGKTKVLTDRVLSLLLNGTPPGKILCLTFTRAAAAEMANRINEALSTWAISDDVSLNRALTKLRGIPPDKKLLPKARRLFRSVLETHGGMKIQTIHSFCESLLGRFPLEAGLAPYFSTLDEAETLEALKEARNRVFLNTSNENSSVTQAINYLCKFLDEGRFSELLETLTNERGRLESVFRQFGGVSGTLVEINKRLDVSTADTEINIINAACTEDALHHGSLRSAGDLMMGGVSKTDMKKGALIVDWLSAQPETRFGGFDLYQSVFFTTTGKIRDNIATKKFSEKYPDLKKALELEALRLQAFRQKLNSLIVARATAALLQVADAMNTNYSNWKGRHGRMDYDDLVLKARSLLESDGGASWVLYKLDGGIDHILIDEAQDTNPDQWALVSALVQEFFSGIGASTVNRTIFAVGDPKQSIYSFQRADPEAFERMRHYFCDQVSRVGKVWGDVSLDVSFRSTVSVLSLVDKVFSDPKIADGVVDGESIKHIACRAGDGGCVEMWPAVTPNDHGDDVPWVPPVRNRSVVEPSVRLAKTIAAQIGSWLSEKETLESKNRPIRAGDILILVRRRSSFVTQLVRELKIRRIPVAGVDRMMLRDQLVVRDLLALGSFLLLPEDDLNLAIVLKGPLFGLNDKDLFILTRNSKCKSLWVSLKSNSKKNQRYKEAASELSDLLRRADFVPPFELFSEILAKRGGLKKIIGRLDSDAIDPIEEFMSRALSYERGRPASLQAFIHSISNDATEVKRDFDEGIRDEVRIMTVHGAKGLQAPIVFLPDTFSKPKIRNGVLWADDNLPFWAPLTENAVGPAAAARSDAIKRQNQEYRRLLYVALTRAEDRLYICGWQGSAKPVDGNWYQILENALKGFETTIDLSELSSEGWSGTGYRLKNPQKAIVDEIKKQDNVIYNEEVRPPTWAFSSPPAEKATEADLTPSGFDEGSLVVSPIASSDRDRFKRGLIIHKLLQFLPGVSKERQEIVARKFVSRPIQDLTIAAQFQIVSEVMRLLNNPSFSEVFAEGSRAEVPLIGKLGDITISGQVDRLAVTSTRVLVIDYKSNRPPPNNPQSVPAAYLRQMSAYRFLVRKIWPNREIECGILWTIGPTLMKLSGDLLDNWEPG